MSVVMNQFSDPELCLLDSQHLVDVKGGRKLAIERHATVKEGTGLGGALACRFVHL